MTTIALIDYGVGNLPSVEKALCAAGSEVCITSDPQAILAADKVVLPGVGAFGDSMAGLRERHLEDVIRQIAREGRPLLGICVGMQLLFEESVEMGEYKGLGLLPGRVKRFTEGSLAGSNAQPSLPAPGSPAGLAGWNKLEHLNSPEASHGLKVPHTGWNQLFFAPVPLLRGLEPGCYAYFNHSYYCEPADASDILARTDYGLRYASMVGRGRLYGMQFHPEKSQDVGLQLLRNFVELG